ncbi:DAR GTPase 2, mitochondrial-like isoform X1 [Chenopodium quinoa]|uniref:DAR GTPase 2, mitochondrial-like isoform X1 n=1 Tax=Chenopodium quinoa TaxID=63459 RepID=UPI000B779229|nr:DAR GTPase 2, mitochondrial-like isoform X1 [Chenopodium quinoa]
MAKRVGNTVIKMAGDGKSLYTPFMAAASTAVSQRIASVDFVLDLRDARIPLSSECELLRRLSTSSSSRRLVVLNKVDLAGRSKVKEWTRYFERESFPTFGVNAHNKDNIQEFLGFLQSQVRALKKSEPERHTITMMLVGIPNVGKSALANSLHHIGRISAAEKGKLKHAVVSPIPGETKSICSLKVVEHSYDQHYSTSVTSLCPDELILCFQVASHPSIYILDTPGILPPQLNDVEACAKLALTGALRDNLAGEKALAQYFLSVLNLNHEYQKWEKLCIHELPVSGNNDKTTTPEVITDHTQDSVVLSVRRSLFEVNSSFRGNLQEEEELLRLIKAEFDVLKKALKLPAGSEDIEHKVAVKLLNLFRTGRLGHYILDSIPVNIEDV